MSGNGMDLRTIAQAAVKHVILTSDPAVPETSTLSWEISKPYCTAVVDLLTSLVSADSHALSVLQGLRSSPDDMHAHRHVATVVERAMRQPLPLAEQLASAVAAAEREILFDYRVGPRYTGAATPVRSEDLEPVAQARPGSSTEITHEDVHIVIPFRDRTGDRIRNLLSAVTALRDQTVHHASYTITVVETDETPRWSKRIEAVADDYFYAPYAGPFNKSWATNIGVMHGRQRSLICILDVDILPDRSFLQRCATHFQDDSVVGLNVAELYFLDEPSTHTAIRQRCLHGAPHISHEYLRGFVMRRPVGGCQWVRTETYHAINGMDERYEGWGGEDRDLLNRLRTVGQVARVELSATHLHHQRQTIRRKDGTLFNTDIPTDWSCAGHHYGRMDRYSSA
jgi:hypothetical protein